MSQLETEFFIRKQIQRILLEKKEEEEGTPDATPASPKSEEGSPAQGQVFGGVGGGDLPGWVKDIFADESGSAAAAKRLAATNPGQLMKNLKVQRGNGKTTLERAKSLIDSARQGTPAYGQSIGDAQERKDKSDRPGLFFPNTGGFKDRYANLFVFDTIRAAATVGYIRMTGHLRVEGVSGGVLVYNVRNRNDRWS